MLSEKQTNKQANKKPTKPGAASVFCLFFISYMQMPQSSLYHSVRGGMLLLHSYHTATAGWCHVTPLAFYAFSVPGLDLLRL